MSPWIWIALGACLLLSAVFSGSETGFYSVSRLRIDAAARRGSRLAGIVRALLADEAGLLVTILVGNNIALELATRLFGSRVRGWEWVPEGAAEVVITLMLTPLVFFTGELLPKDLFRRRAHALTTRAAPIVLAAKWLLLPIALPLRGLTWILERVALRRVDGSGALGRQAVRELLEEGALQPHARSLAANVLQLRHTRVAEVMTPWADVERVDASAGSEELRAAVGESTRSRVPIVEQDGRVSRYVHQLDVLGAPDEPQLAELARPLAVLDPDSSVDRALASLRTAGQRVALVGEAGAPLGLVSLKDLVEEISGELGGW